jgi:hypothetical protein
MLVSMTIKIMTQHYDTQHHGTQHHDTQHYDSQHKGTWRELHSARTTQHNSIRC